MKVDGNYWFVSVDLDRLTEHLWNVFFAPGQAATFSGVILAVMLDIRR